MNLDISPVWISLKTATTATAIAFVLGLLAARWMLGYRGKAKGLIDGILTSPLVLPPSVIGFLLLLLFGKQGPAGKLLQLFDLTVMFSWWATVIAATVVAFPLMYKTSLGALRQIDSNLLACSRTLGASEWTVFWRIMLPLAKPGIIAGTLLAFARALGEFGATLMLAGNIPGKTQTIPIAIFFAAESGAMDKALIWVLVILALSLGVITAVNFWSEDRQPHPKEWGYRNKARLRGLSVGNFWSDENSDNVPGPIPHLLYGGDNQDKFELIVDIQKQLPGFLLDVSFTTHEGALGLLGASGAGKSMILRCIAGLSTPDRGRIILNGRVLLDDRRGINLPSHDRRVGFLFQNYALFPHMTVAENIAFALPTPKSALAIKRQVEALLVAVQLQEMGDRYPHELSGGQQQRVAIARVFAREPQVLLLDEPFSALDTHLRDRLEKLLIATVRDYQGPTIFVTHNLSEAYRVCSNLLVVEGGKIVAQGSKQQIFERPPTLGVAQLTGCKNFSRAVAVSPQEIEAIDWGCTLQVIEPIPEDISHIGIRAHHLTFPEEANSENTFPCWLAATSESPHRMTLYLKLYHTPTSFQDYHLQAEVFKEKWEMLKDRLFPWRIHLHPLRLMLLPE